MYTMVMTLMTVSSCFRPLTGNGIFNLKAVISDNNWYISSFRPLTGNGIFNEVMLCIMCFIMMTMFPSPHGERDF